MNNAVDAILILLILSDLALLGLSLINTCISVVAYQGLLLGVFAVLIHVPALSARLLIIAAGGALLKGCVFPFLLRRAIKEAGIQRELQPFVGYSLSGLIGVLMLGISLWLGSRLSIRGLGAFPLAIPAGLMTLFTGLFLAVARKKALTQCLGYLVLENGIYAFGIATVAEIPALVELGLLLDAFVAVFVMGIAIYHINREFDHMDAHQLDTLKG